jgi:hypothetical protein
MVTSSFRSARRRVTTRLFGHELDRRLAAGERGDRDGRLAERARFLTGARTRERLASSLREVVAAADEPPRRDGSVPLARAEVSAAAHELRLLASRLQAPAPVDPRGVAEVRLLLTEGSGPLYNRRSETPLALAATAAWRALAPEESASVPVSEAIDRQRARRRPPGRPSPPAPPTRWSSPRRRPA